jgi:hypothetical protein
MPPRATKALDPVSFFCHVVSLSGTIDNPPP